MRPALPVTWARIDLAAGIGSAGGFRERSSMAKCTTLFESRAAAARFQKGPPPCSPHVWTSLWKEPLREPGKRTEKPYPTSLSLRRVGPEASAEFPRKSVARRLWISG